MCNVNHALPAVYYIHTCTGAKMNSYRRYTLHCSPVVDCVVVSGTDVHVGVLTLDAVAVGKRQGGIQ